MQVVPDQLNQNKRKAREGFLLHQENTPSPKVLCVIGKIYELNIEVSAYHSDKPIWQT